MSGTDARLVNSPRAGGRYLYSEIAEALIRELRPEQKALLTSWMIEQRWSGEDRPSIDREAIKAACSRRQMKVSEQCDALIRYLGRCNLRPDDQWVFREEAGKQGLFDPLQLLAEMGARSYDEGKAIYDLLVKEGYISLVTAPGMWLRLEPSGFRRLEELETTNRDSLQVFAAMWFSDDMNEAWRLGIAPAVRDAGYRPLRIDRKEHNNKIDDEIVGEIKRSRFVVADFTCGVVSSNRKIHAIPRGGVYYEAGLAHGLGLEVIFTCRADRMSDVHFDTRQFAHIVWNTPEQLRAMLYNRIAATVGVMMNAPGRGNADVDPLPVEIAGFRGHDT